ncbi:hypothetical protein K493DRAFT_295323 [Basidiobolus meristosporus CBS 931.73]|uniref:C2 domain-containing protein n=1 Tax=Basidiobolus meristosporus CBS 931.73 TaxID=1314790 RepID=A0A1Y1ZD29_9FUNG|nr:hypothetical protein K493DRAFT_295323 [Basidiobolus meristosporus CBS 931.73]|eukprot:ORY07877.1 hypothetical protein K493DRAFT_295323 [Basidiobolus meristosporus CBS 931.73]
MIKELHSKQVYPYVLRCALLTQNLAEEKVTREYKKRSFHITSHHGGLPKQFIKALRERLGSISRLPSTNTTYGDNLSRKCITLMASSLHDRSYYSTLKENGKMEDLVIFYSKTVSTQFRQQGIESSQSTKERLLEYVRIFVSILRDVLVTFPQLATADILKRLENYQLIIQPAAAKQSSASEGKLADWVGELYEVSSREHQRVVESFSNMCNGQSAFWELKECLSNLEKGTGGVLTIKDFKTPELFETWKSRERTTIQQFMMSLARTGRADQSAAIEYTKPGFTYMPQDPKGCYLNLLRRCVQKDILGHVKKSTETLSLSKLSNEILAECGYRWRLTKLFRKVAYLNVINDQFESGAVPLSYLDSAVLMLKKTTEECDEIDWNIPDSNYLLCIFEAMVPLLLQQFEHSFRMFGTTSPQTFRIVISMLSEIHQYPLYQEKHTNQEQFYETFRDIVLNSTIKRFYELRELVSPEPDAAEALTLLELNELILRDIAKYQKCFPKPVFSQKIDIISIVLHFPLKNFFIPEVQNMVNDKKSENIPIEDTFKLYNHVLKLHHIAQEHCPEIDFQIDLGKWFKAQVERWLNTLGSKANDWVERAIAVDQFTMISDRLRHSTSVVDLFSFFQQQIRPSSELIWPDELLKAQFVLKLSKVISQIVEQYCQITLDTFIHDLKAIPPELHPTGSSSWMNLGKKPHIGSFDENLAPTDISLQACVKLNNIEIAQDRLNDLYHSLDIDKVSLTLEGQSPRSELDTPESPMPYVHRYFVEVVLGQDLQPCDRNGLSDPYVVLKSNGREIGRTRIIYENLNPRWEETFQISFSGVGSVEVVVFDKDMMKDDDCCGTAYFNLDPAIFCDYFTHDVWLDLEPQGRILLRVHIEGEKNDAQFYFGKTFRTLKSTHVDMIRTVINRLSSQTKGLLSRNRLIMPFKRNNYFSFMKSSNKTASRSITDEECDRMLYPLFDYLDNNLGMINENIYDVLAENMIEKIWKEVLLAFERLLIPLFDVEYEPLEPYEIDMIYRCIEFIKIYFNGGEDGDGIPMERLTTRKYKELCEARELFSLSTKDLMNEYNISMKKSAQKPGHREKDDRQIQRHFGTIKERKSEKRLFTERCDYILRILQTHSDKEAKHFVVNQLDLRRKQQQLNAANEFKSSNQRRSRSSSITPNPDALSRPKSSYANLMQS